MSTIGDRAQYWGVTEAERAATYPCEAHAPEPYRRYLRAVDMDAEPDVIYRWVCQLKVAPYSYDWLDNWGRQSPRELSAGADELAIGQRFMIARIVDFEPGRHITGVSTPGVTRLFGPIALTYQVGPQRSGSRLIAAMTVGASSPAGRLRRELLGWGDLVMMRKQLLTLKECAAQSTASRSSAS